MVVKYPIYPIYRIYPVLYPVLYAALSCPILPCSVLSHPISSYRILSISCYLIRSHPFSSYLILSYPVSSYLYNPISPSYPISFYLSLSHYLILSIQPILYPTSPYPILSYPNPIPSYLPYLSYLSYLCFLSYLILSVPIQQHTTRTRHIPHFPRTLHTFTLIPAPPSTLYMLHCKL